MDVPVVSIGNLTVGGTGKTPAVELAVQTLITLGHRPAIVSRGYGRTSRGVQVVADDATIRLDAEDAGDGNTREMVGDGVDGEAKRVGFREQRGYVLEAHTGPREVGHISHVLEQPVGIGDHVVTIPSGPLFDLT